MIEVKNLSKNYGPVPAVKGISVTVKEGCIYGFLGPNGAGKSSTIKIMSGVLTPDSGECLINGRIPWKDRVEHAKEIGVVFGQRSQLWWDVPVNDSFELIVLGSASGKDAIAYVEKLLTDVPVPLE